MSGRFVPRFVCRGTKILQHEDPHCAGAPAAAAQGFDFADQLADVQCSRWQISTSASHSSGSRRMLVRPRPATTLRLIKRLPVTAAP